MRFDLNVQQMRAHMGLWRDAVAIRPGLAGVPATNDRAKLLAEAVAMTRGWLDLLAMCSSDGDELRTLCTEIRSFQDWARTGAIALALLDDVRR